MVNRLLGPAMGMLMSSIRRSAFPWMLKVAAIFCTEGHYVENEDRLRIAEGAQTV